MLVLCVDFIRGQVVIKPHFETNLHDPLVNKHPEEEIRK